MSWLLGRCVCTVRESTRTLCLSSVLTHDLDAEPEFLMLCPFENAVEKDGADAGDLRLLVIDVEQQVVGESTEQIGDISLLDLQDGTLVSSDLG